MVATGRGLLTRGGPPVASAAEPPGPVRWSRRDRRNWRHGWRRVAAPTRASGAGPARKVCDTPQLDGPATRPVGAVAVDHEEPPAPDQRIACGHHLLAQTRRACHSRRRLRPGAAQGRRHLRRRAGRRAGRAGGQPLRLQQLCHGRDRLLPHDPELRAGHRRQPRRGRRQPRIRRQLVHPPQHGAEERRCRLFFGNDPGRQDPPARQREHGFESGSRRLRRTRARPNEILQHTAGSRSSGRGCTGGDKFWDTREPGGGTTSPQPARASAEIEHAVPRRGQLHQRQRDRELVEISYTLAPPDTSLETTGRRARDGQRQRCDLPVRVRERRATGQRYGRHLRISGNRFVDNWSGIRAWENPADTSVARGVAASSGRRPTASRSSRSLEVLRRSARPSTEPEFCDRGLDVAARVGLLA